MSWLLITVGTLLVLLTVLDLLWTTLWVDGGAGPLSRWATRGLWRGLRAVGGGSRLFSLAGPLALVATLLLWIALLWAGWTLVFAGGEPSLLDTRANEPIAWTGRAWFAAYTLFTVGNGDFTPIDGPWQIAAALTAASGMTFVTFAVSYVLSVLSAVASKRSFASGVTGLGESAEEFVLSGWDGQSFHALDRPLGSAASELDRLADQHRTYPILHYYHSERAEAAAAVAVAVLDEALTVLSFGVAEKARPNRAILKSARSSVRSHLRTLVEAGIAPAERPPPSPDLARLAAAGVPVVSETTFTHALGDLAERRRKLLGVVAADARGWPPAGSGTPT
jgi:hypothetical protein